MNYNLRLATADDAVPFAEKLREADKAEIKAASGLSSVDALRDGIAISDVTYVAETENGDPICIFGVSKHPLNEGCGIPWMVGTDLIQTYFFVFLRDGKTKLLPLITTTYPLLVNVVDSRNTVHLRWLEWMGFDIDKSPIFLTDPEVPFFTLTYHGGLTDV